MNPAAGPEPHGADPIGRYCFASQGAGTGARRSCISLESAVFSKNFPSLGKKSRRVSGRTRVFCGSLFLKTGTRVALSGENTTVENNRSSHAVWIGVWILVGSVLLFTASGCLATRSWVNDQLNPISGRLNQTDAKADRALSGLQNLHLEQQLVLDSTHGPTFAFASANLTENAKREIDGFFQDFEGSTHSASAPGRLFVVAGYTDSIGSEGYNYELGQRRASRVAGYLISKEGVDPMQLRVVSYGASKPVADNSTSRGRRSNRRVEILVYQQKIATGS
jgi:outer membrane protein OmpA-like peptidoglycan-associated protein